MTGRLSAARASGWAFVDGTVSIIITFISTSERAANRVGVTPTTSTLDNNPTPGPPSLREHDQHVWELPTWCADPLLLADRGAAGAEAPGRSGNSPRGQRSFRLEPHRPDQHAGVPFWPRSRPGRRNQT